MTKEADVLDAVQQVLKIAGRQDKVDTQTNFGDIMDSMNMLEVLLILEEKGYVTTHITVDGMDTIQELIDIL